MGTASVLVVDSDAVLCTALAEQLQVNGEFSTEIMGSLAAAEAALRARRFEAILLEMALPDGNGADFCRALRVRDVKIPILMMASLGDEASVVQGLESGANDYLVKPFRLNELLARLRAHLRSYEQAEDLELPLGPYYFRPALRQVVDEKGGKIRLTDKETAILKYLYRAKGPVSRQTLLEAVWGYSQGISTHTLETHIYRLRQKIEQSPPQERLLLTDGGGYRLNI